MKRFTAMVAGAAALGAVAWPAAAETISYTEATQALIGACGSDISALCKGIKPGGGRLQVCLLNNAAKVSPPCMQTYEAVFASLKARAEAQAAVPKACRRDAERICSNFRAGNARILRCLIRKDNVRKVTKKCNRAITDAGWR